jgi:hypothetical protein
MLLSALSPIKTPQLNDSDNRSNLGGTV